MKVISYSLFGHGKERQANCFDFNSYLRGLMVNLRLQRLLFPDWVIFLHVDKATYEGFKELFDKLEIYISICEDAPLTKAMLWRLKPLFEPNIERIICRDLDSPLTYRDAQAVKMWELSGKGAHTITDSVSHNIPMMGGMVGFLKDNFPERVGFKDWDSMVDSMNGYEVKGADQDFLNRIVYPKFAGTDSSIMQHYFLGMPNTFLDGYLTCSCYSIQGHKEHCPLNTKLDLDESLKGSNAICGHIGAGGYYEGETLRFLGNYREQFEDIREAEKPFKPEIFFWNI